MTRLMIGWKAAVLAVGLVVSRADVASAQPGAAASVVSVHDLKAGSCTVVVGITNPAKSQSAEVDIEINGLWVARQTLNGRTQVSFKLRGPLEATNAVRARLVGLQNADGAWVDPPTIVGPGTGVLECPDPTQRDASADQRDAFTASAYLGSVFDNFAPAEVGGYATNTSGSGYINPSTGGTSRMRSVVGVDFQFRAVGNQNSQVQLWLVGETLHGVRSADVDCTSQTDRPPVCESLAAQFNKGPGASFLYGLEHASSFEAYLAPRLELVTLQKSSSLPSKLYVTFRLGINMLDSGAPHAYDAYHLGTGLLAPSGPFGGSYLEVGWGKTDLFYENPKRLAFNRLKIDGMLSFPILQAFTDKAKFWKKAPRAFVQLYSDFDPVGSSADSVQTFVGIDFDVAELFRW